MYKNVVFVNILVGTVLRNYKPPLKPPSGQRKIARYICRMKYETDTLQEGQFLTSPAL
jgi:hypothetical protein